MSQSSSDQRRPRIQRHDNGDVTIRADVRLSRADTLRLMDELAVAVYGSTKRRPVPGPPNPPRSYADEYGPLGGYGGES